MVKPIEIQQKSPTYSQVSFRRAKAPVTFSIAAILQSNCAVRSPSKINDDRRDFGDIGKKGMKIRPINAFVTTPITLLIIN